MDILHGEKGENNSSAEKKKSGTRRLTLCEEKGIRRRPVLGIAKEQHQISSA